MKIAIASSDGKIIDQHFGQACHVLIYQIEREGLRLIELREKNNEPICNHEYMCVRGLELLKDCKVLFCKRIGDVPKKKLHEQGIEVVESKKETIPHAVVQYLTKMTNEIRMD
ncbi:MAG: Dinitrogenase iron-molybdenum cofactor [Methanobacterium sp. PtaB.Bin024]|jgi:predicted Fe-Mo cluster-binding NifX family protein|nr:MAG: Dinitrogenase iron-molybdenum cofactor [Methanobacterium sp. PtaB.Bin024]